MYEIADASPSQPKAATPPSLTEALILREFG
jgi:hypothetical protein